MHSTELLAALKTNTRFTPTGAPLGNLTVGRGMIDGAAAHIAMVEGKIASGSLSIKECEKLAALFRVVTAERSQLLLYLDSAGARVSEGLAALGAFRQLYRAALDLSMSGAGFQCVLGANCFGGTSMLAALAQTRLFADDTRLAMSGPALLAQTAGFAASDEMFQALSQAAIGSAARVALDASNVPSATHILLKRQGALDFAARHPALKARLPQTRIETPERIERKDLAKLYPSGYALSMQAGVLSGSAQAGDICVVGLLGNQALGAARAAALAALVWAQLIAPPKTLHLLIECESHATTLGDERLFLSAYLADLACALNALRNSGCRVITQVLTKLGGGVYLALCAPASEVVMLYGAEVQMLPSKAIASILGGHAAQTYSFQDYQHAGVAETELKLGIV